MKFIQAYIPLAFLAYREDSVRSVRMDRIPIPSPENFIRSRRETEDAAFHFSYWDDDIPS